MSNKRWAELYRSKQSPEVGDLIFAYHRGVHRVIEVRDCPYSEFRNKRTVVYVQVTDRRFNPILRNRRTRQCDILWTMPFESRMQNSSYVDPKAIIERVRSFVSPLDSSLVSG